MKVISVNNNHIKKPESEPEKEYGCVCHNCGTVFTFKESEASIPKFISPTPKNCTIMCPNCKYTMTLAQCRAFKNLREREEFEYHYDRRIERRNNHGKYFNCKHWYKNQKIT